MVFEYVLYVKSYCFVSANANRRNHGLSFDFPKLYDIWFEQLEQYRFIEVVGQPKDDKFIGGFAGLLDICVEFMASKGVSLFTPCVVFNLLISLL